MKSQTLSAASLLASGAMAMRPFINEADTGIDLSLGGLKVGELPELKQMVGLPDFDWAARNFLSAENYTYYRNGAAGEWTYRENLEVYGRYPLRPRTMIDISDIESSFPTTILGHNFSAPFYISPCARADYAHTGAEINLVKAAGAKNILYIPSHYAHNTIEEIGDAKTEGQVIFQQVYLDSNDTITQREFDRAKKAGSKAIVFTIDAAAPSNRQRADRFDVGSANKNYKKYSWDYYKKLTNMTDLPILLKGIQTAEDAKLAHEHGVPGIIISNHGGRQLDSSRSTLEVALEIHRECPDLFTKMEIFVDGGVRYGTDVLKLLALGVKAVGLGRPFMFSNIFGQEGIEKVVEMLKNEIAVGAGNLGVPDLKKINDRYVAWNTPSTYAS